MKFRTLSTLAAAAMSLSFSFGAHAQVAGLPALGLQTLGLSGNLLALPVPGGVPTVPGLPSLSPLSLGTLTSLLGTSGLPGVPGTPSLPGLPTNIAGLPALPGTSNAGDLNLYLVGLSNDLNGLPVPRRLNLLFSNSPIPAPFGVPDFPAFPGAQGLADMRLPLVSDLIGQLIVLNRTSFFSLTGTGSSVPSLPSLPGLPTL